MDSHILYSISQCMGWRDPRNMKHLIVRGLDVPDSALNQIHNSLSMTKWALNEDLVSQIDIRRYYSPWRISPLDGTFDTTFETIISYTTWDMLNTDKVQKEALDALLSRDILIIVVLLAYGAKSWRFSGHESVFDTHEPLPELGRLFLLYKFDSFVEYATGNYCEWPETYDDTVYRFSDWGTTEIIDCDICFRMNEF